MKIIDNKKDFYDYLVGEYGIDDLTVFDRREAVVLKTDVKPEMHKDYIFSAIKGDKDIYPKEVFFPVRGLLISLAGVQVQGACSAPANGCQPPLRSFPKEDA
jgi:hypothetical protein